MQRIEYLWNNSIRRVNEIEVTFLCSLITWFTRLQLIHVTHANWPNQQECQMARVTSVHSFYRVSLTACYKRSLELPQKTAFYGSYSIIRVNC